MVYVVYVLLDPSRLISGRGEGNGDSLWRAGKYVRDLGGPVVLFRCEDGHGLFSRHAGHLAAHEAVNGYHFDLPAKRVRHVERAANIATAIASCWVPCVDVTREEFSRRTAQPSLWGTTWQFLSLAMGACFPFGRCGFLGAYTRRGRLFIDSLGK